MDALPLELILSILEHIRIDNGRASEMHVSLAPLSCINRNWRLAVESILWNVITITIHAHRHSLEWDDFRRFTSGSRRQQRRGTINSLTLCWIKYTEKEEKRELAEIKTGEIDPAGTSPISPRTSQQSVPAISDCKGEHDQTIGDDEHEEAMIDGHEIPDCGCWISDGSDEEEPDDGLMDDMCRQLRLAQDNLFAYIGEAWGYLQSWADSLVLQCFRVRIVCDGFCNAANDVLPADNERYLHFLRADLPTSFRLPLLRSLRLLDVDDSRELAYWPAVVGLRILLATPSTVPRLFAGGGPLRMLPNRVRPWKKIGRSVIEGLSLD